VDLVERDRADGRGGDGRHECRMQNAECRIKRCRGSDGCATLAPLMGKRSRSKREIRATETPRASSTQHSALSTQHSVLIAAALALSVLVVFAQVARHDFINFDDPDYVVTNPHVATGFSPS